MPLYFTHLNSSLASKKPASQVLVSRMQPPPKTSEVFVPSSGLHKRNPIRHYRRSMTATGNTNNQVLTREIFNQFDQPGKAIITSTSDSDVCDCAQFAEKVYPNSTAAASCSSSLEVCHRPILSASTIIDKSKVGSSGNCSNKDKVYSTTMREFRQRRGQSYLQNLPTNHSKVGLSANCPEDPAVPIVNNNTPYSCNINSGTGAKSNSEYQHSLFYRSTNGTVVFIHNDKCISCGLPAEILYKKNMNMTPKACGKCLNRMANYSKTTNVC